MDLPALLEAWRTSRDPRLADALDRADREAARPKLPGRTVADRQAAWDKAFKKYDPADLPRLLDPLLSFGRLGVEYRLRLLAAKGPDPRLGAALTGWVVQRPNGYQGQATDVLWGLVLDAVADAGDVRQLPALEAVHAQVTADIRCHADTVLRARLPAVLAALRAVSATVPEPATPAPAVDRESLFAAVYADPDDDAPRAVLADLLLAAGDPRGELIALQLRPDDRAAAARARALVAAHGRSWAGRLGPALRKDGLVFRRGFLAGCTIGSTPAPVDLDAPEWATVELLRMSEAVIPSTAWPKMVSLRRLSGRCGGVFSSPGPLPRLEELDVVGPYQAPRACPALPALRRLALADLFGLPEPTLWTGLFGQLESLTIDHVVGGELADWQRWMALAPPAMAVSIGHVATGVRLTRADGAWNAVVRQVDDFPPGERARRLDAARQAVGAFDQPVPLQVIP